MTISAVSASPATTGRSWFPRPACSGGQARPSLAGCSAWCASLRMTDSMTWWSLGRARWPGRGHGLFCFIGAEPAGGWLPAEVTRDDNGFVLTDVAVPQGRVPVRPRLPYETAMDGVFAAGD